MAARELVNSSLFYDANLVSYWRFEGNSTDYKDSNNGTDNNITYSAGNGKFGQGAGYVATNSSKIVLTDATSLKPTGNFSVLLWFKTSTSGANKMMFQSFSLNTNRAGFYVFNNSADGVEFLSGKNSGSVEGTDWARAVYSTSVTDGVYHMLVAVWDGSNLNLYIDNNTVVQTAWANAPVYAVTNYPRIGCDNNTGTDQLFFDGSLDDVALFSRALTPTEVSNHFNG